MIGSEVGGACFVFSDVPWCRMWNERVVLQNKRETWTARTRYGLTREGGITGRFRADPSLGGECQCDTSFQWTLWFLHCDISTKPGTNPR